MVKQLIVHLGDCKTGTTALQSCLASGGYTLPRGRICYPTQHNHNLLALPLSTLAEAPRHVPYRKARWAQVAAALEASDADWGVISAELFEFVPPAALRAALDDVLPGYRGRTRLVAYVRPHHARIVSGYAEALKKTGAPATLNSYANSIQRRGAMYHPRFSAWQAVFGADLTVRPMIRDRLVQGDVVADFLAFVSGDQDVTVAETPRDNSALSLPELAMMREVHARLGTARKGRGDAARLACRQLGWQLAPLLAAHRPEPGPKLGMHLTRARLVRDSFAGDAAAMDADFFDGTPFTDALNAATDTFGRPQSLNVEDYYDAGQIAMIRAWADFTRRLIDADPRHFFRAAMAEHERGDLPGAVAAADRTMLGQFDSLRHRLGRLLTRGR